MRRQTTNSGIERYKYLIRFFQPNKKVPNPYFKNLFNPYSYYDMLREDVDGCCEIAIRYGLVVDEERGLLKGGRNIYSDSTLYELRVARLFESERYFDKGCLSWDPAGSASSVGEFKLTVSDVSGIKHGIFVEVKTREKQDKTEFGTLVSNEDRIIGMLQKAYKKVKDGLQIPFLVVLCYNRYKVYIDSFQIIKSCFGLIDLEKGTPEILKHGYLSPDKHNTLSAIALYYFYVDGNKEYREHFEIYHNNHANMPIKSSIFENKANGQFNLLEWNGKFTDA